MASQFPHLLPFKPKSVLFDFPPSIGQTKGLCVKPLSTLELLWVNKVSSTFVPPPPIDPVQAIIWLDRKYPDVWVPEDVIKPLLAETCLSDLNPHQNIIASCWVSGHALLCFSTGELVDSFSALIVDSSLPPKLQKAMEENAPLPASSVCVGFPIRHIKLNTTGIRTLGEDLLAAVATDMCVLVYHLIPQDDANGTVKIRLVTKIPFRAGICCIAFTGEYLVTVTSDGGIFCWDPLRDSDVRVLKKGTSGLGKKYKCTPGSQYNQVFVSDSTSLFSYDFRGKLTYQTPVIFNTPKEDRTIVDIHIHPSNPFHLALHTNSLQLYDVRYRSSPFISWSRLSKQPVHSISVLPMYNNTNFIISTTVEGEINLYQYKNGTPPAQRKQTWDPYQPLSSLVSQFPTFFNDSASTLSQTTTPYPSQTPYSFSNIRSVTSQPAEVAPLFAGIAVLPNWVMNPADPDFQLFHISHYGDIFVQSLSLHQYGQAQTKFPQKVSALGEAALNVYQKRASEFATARNLPSIEITRANKEGDEVSILEFLRKVPHPVTVDEITSKTKQTTEDTYSTLSETTDYTTDYITSDYSLTDYATTDDESHKRNTIKRAPINPRLANIPAESVPTITEPSAATDEIQSYLDVFMLNCKLLDPVIPIGPSTFSTIAQDRSTLENHFSDKMNQFMSSQQHSTPTATSTPPIPSRKRHSYSWSSMPDSGTPSTPKVSSSQPPVVRSTPVVLSTPLSAPVIRAATPASGTPAPKRRRRINMGF